MYTDQQSRLVRAFCHSGTSCVCDCDCGRVHFVSADGHGDYEEGELEALQAKAKREPDKYIEESQFDTIDILHIGGVSLVPDCPCDRAIRYAKFLDDHAEDVAAYVTALLTERRKAAEREEATAKRIIAELEAAQAKEGWLPIRSGPHNLTHVEVKDQNGDVYPDAHWASDRSGEEQPPFEGWFAPAGSGFRQIENPQYWRPKGTS